MNNKKLDKRFKTYGIFHYVCYCDYNEWLKMYRSLCNLGWRGGAVNIYTPADFKIMRFGYNIHKCTFYFTEKDATYVQLMYV